MSFKFNFSGDDKGADKPYQLARTGPGRPAFYNTVKEIETCKQKLKFIFVSHSHSAAAVRRRTNRTEASTIQDIEWFASEEIIPKNQIEDLDSIVKHAKMFTCGDVEIGHIVTSEAVANILSENGIFNATECAEKSHSDLIAGKYEGGLKIWECTHDLVEYLVNNEELKLESKKVLDLGCGAGILGIYAFINGASVTFQDYNKEVLEHVTIPNVLLNIEEDDTTENMKRCKFYSGDWDSFNKLVDESVTYDVILSSETIYNENNYDKLINLFLKRLSKTGAVYLAAKTCYFGVGGGLRQFESKINNNGSLQSEICWKSTGGIQREILKITHKS